MTNSPPLTGVKVLEFAGIAPSPFAGMLLADAGASILRIDRASPSTTPPPSFDPLARHKSSIAVNLKSPRGVSLIKKLIPQVDILIDPFRPGVLERLDLGPDVLCGINPRLVYGRLSGFRRDGKYKDMAGHDINYLAVAGTLSMLGRDGEKPHAPWNIVADFAGGGATLFQGILLALFARSTTGKGQVVETNMVDGSSYLTTYPRMLLKSPIGNNGRGKNLLDGGSPYYDTYETKDGKYMSVGALEPPFFKALIQGLGLEGQGWEDTRTDRSRWPELASLFETTFKSKTRADWEAIFDGTDACCLPVLDYDELETDSGREGDQRPPVTLRDTPFLAQSKGTDPILSGQGSGVRGEGYSPMLLVPGEGGEKILNEWAGWTRGKEYDLEKGGAVWTDKESKL